MTAIFIRRPVMTTLVMISMLFFGTVAYFSLPVSNVPNVDYPTIQVTASLPGASPETMASTVAMPLEKQFSTIAGLESMSSTNTQGSTTISLQFELDRKIDAAALDVQSSISAAGSDLPPDLPTPPSFSKSNPSDMPILFIALNSDTLRLTDLYDYASTFLSQRISTISGVAQVQVYGSRRSYRVQVDPDALSARDIGIDEIMGAIQAENVKLPTGTLDGKTQSITVEAKGQLETLDGYRSIIVATRNNHPIRLDEVATLVEKPEQDKIMAELNQKQSIVLAIRRQPGTNTVDVANSIKKILPTIKQKLPASVQMKILYDMSSAIKESVDDVKFTLILAVALVVLVVFLFLRSFAATLICSLALPMSLIATFACMFMKGYSLDNLSLMALTLSVGFLVDDAIVMLENIVRHLDMGKTPMQASLDGSKEVGFTIVSMTLSLVAVFIPVVFMSGMVGRILNEFAITITMAIIVSGFVSLSLTPMLCSRILKRGAAHEDENKGFNAWLKHKYQWALHLVLRYRRTTLNVSFVILGLTGLLFLFIPKGFVPSDDMGYLYGFTVAEQGISFDAMIERQRKIVPIILANPNVESVVSVVGVAGSNIGIAFIRLKDRSERSFSADQVLGQLSGKLFSATPGLLAMLQNPPTINVSGGRPSRGIYQYTLQDVDVPELYDAAQRLEVSMKKLQEIRDVDSNLQIKNPQANLYIDRDKARTLGLSARQIEEALFTAYAARKVSTIYATNDQYPVMLEVAPEHRKDIFDLDSLYVRSSGGSLVSLSTVARIESAVGALQVNHTGQLASVTISFNVNQGFALGQATEAVQKAVDDLHLPSGITSNFEGSANVFKSSLTSMGMLFGLAVVVIYIILGILYENFIHPVTILSGLPSAALGGLLTLLFFGYELNLYGMVGLLLLIGIVKKNSIMMVDFAIEARRSGLSAEEAITQGALTRFRPIMMTTMAAIAGAVPIALGLGAGAESRRPLGLVIVGGLIFSQVVTLLLTPIMYLYMERFQAWLDRNKKPAKETAKKETIICDGDGDIDPEPEKDLVPGRC